MSVNLRLLERELTGLNGRSISFVLAASCCCLLGNIHFGEASQDVKLDVLEKSQQERNRLIRHQPWDCIAIMGVREIAQRWAIIFLLEVICALFIIPCYREGFWFICKFLESIVETQRFRTVLR